MRTIHVGILSAWQCDDHRTDFAAQPRPADRGDDTWSKQMKYNKSWIEIDSTALEALLVEGDKIQVPVEYLLDPSEHYQTTTLTFEARAPRPQAVWENESCAFNIQWDCPGLDFVSERPRNPNGCSRSGATSWPPAATS